MFNIKSDGCYRSQLVTKGFSYVKEFDFDELFSSVGCYKTACLFLVVATLEDWNIYNVDIKTIYLYSDLDEKIKQPGDFRLPGKEKKI